MQYLNIINIKAEQEDKSFSYKQDLIRFVSLIIVSAFVIYFTSKLPIKIYFLILLVLFWQSKKDYFWFAFMFVLINEPGGLFSGGTAELINRVPLYRIGVELAFSYYDLFILLALVKSIVKGKKPNVLFIKPLQLLLLYAIFLFCFSIIAGMSFDNFISLSRTAVVYTLIYSISSLLTNKKDLYILIHLILPFSFLIVFAQFYELSNQKALITFFDTSREVRIGSWEGDIRAVMEGVLIIFFSYVFSLFYLSKKDYQGSKAYLWVIIIICSISVIVSATRSWIGMFISILVLYFLFIAKLNKKIMVTSIIVLILLLLLYRVWPIFHNAIDTGFSRFGTVKFLAEGDITAGGTLQRFDVRLPKVLKGFYQSPVIGWGFGETYNKYDDSHVGNFNLLLQTGIIGFGLFLYFWLTSIRTIYRIYKLTPAYNEYLVFILGITGMLILHFTTFEFFNYTISYWPIQIFIIYYFVIVSKFLILHNKQLSVAYQHKFTFPKYLIV